MCGGCSKGSCTELLHCQLYCCYHFFVCDSTCDTGMSKPAAPAAAKVATLMREMAKPASQLPSFTPSSVAEQQLLKMEKTVRVNTRSSFCPLIPNCRLLNNGRDTITKKPRTRNLKNTSSGWKLACVNFSLSTD